MGISDDIRKKKTETIDKLAEENEEEPETVEENENTLEPGEVPVDVKVSKASIKKSRYDDFLSDWDREHILHERDEEVARKDEHLKNYQGSTKTKRRGNGFLKWIILLFLILATILVWQNFSRIENFLDIKPQNQEEADKDVTYYNNSKTNYSNDLETKDQSSASPEDTTENTTSATTIDKSSIALQVLNGNGISGSAVKVRDILTSAGFTVSSTTNAKLYTYETTIVYYKSGKEAEAHLVKDALSSYSTSLSNLDSIMGIYDVIVVVGKT